MTDISLWSLFVAQQDCRVTEVGYDYRGDVSVTRTGVPCENDTLCRNSADTPGRERAWCFTDEAVDEWDYCNVFFVNVGLSLLQNQHLTIFAVLSSCSQGSYQSINYFS